MTKFLVRKTHKYGRGVFATKNLKKGEVIERSPCIIFSKEEHYKFVDTLMNFYVFGWPNGGASQTALALGVGSLFNHDTDPNVSYSTEAKTQKMIFRACRNVKRGEQLFINYGYDPLEVLKIKKLQEKDDKKELQFLGLEASLKTMQKEEKKPECPTEEYYVWDPEINGGLGGEVKRLRPAPYGVIRDGKFKFWDEIKKPTYLEPETPFINFSMSRIDAALTLAFLLMVFVCGLLQGSIPAGGY